MDGIGPAETKVKEIEAQISSGTIKEIFLAISSTVPGVATASFLIDRLQNRAIRITRLACGIPMGMDIKYANKHTLARAIESRSETR